MTSQPTRTGLAVAAAAGLVALAGCGSGEQETATAETTRSPEPSATPAQVPAALRGRWRRTVRQADLGAIVLPLGAWGIEVLRKGAADVYAPRKDSVDFTMKLTTDGQRLTFGTAPACTSSGTYTWQATERRLTLSDAEDTCSARVAIFAGTWTRRR